MKKAVSNKGLLIILLLSVCCGIGFTELISDNTISMFEGFMLTIPTGLLIGMLVAYLEAKDDSH